MGLDIWTQRPDKLARYSLTVNELFGSAYCSPLPWNVTREILMQACFPPEEAARAIGGWLPSGLGL